MSPLIMKILRDLVLVFGILFLVWGLGQYQYGKVQHGVGTASTPIDTQMASPGSIINVKVTSDNTTETRVIKLESRDAFYQNGTLVDKYLVAGGANNGGRGRSVDLTSAAPSLSPTAYRIVVLDADGTTDNIDSIEYTVNYTVWMPNYQMVLIGLLLIVGTMVMRKLSKIQTTGVPVDVGAQPEPAPMPARAPPVRAPPARTPQPGYGRQPPVRTPARAPPPPPPDEYEEPQAPEEYPPPEEEVPPEPEPEVVAPPPRAPAAAPPKPVARIRCSACGEIIPIYTKNRPVRITCSNCGRSGTLK